MAAENKVRGSTTDFVLIQKMARIHPVKRLARRFGFRLERIRRLADPSQSEEIFPSATYAPWKLDREFLQVYETVRPDSFLTKYHAWIVWQLVEQVSKLQGCLIEVGVWRGGSGTLIGSRARQLGIRDTVYLCDTFRGIVKAAPDEPLYKDGVHATSREAVDRLIEQFQLDTVRVLAGVFPDETGVLVTDKQVRLCHIDVDVYQSARDIFDWVWGRMVVGGVVIYDDYGDWATRGVIQHVQETRMREDLIFIHSLAGQAIFVKIK